MWELPPPDLIQPPDLGPHPKISPPAEVRTIHPSAQHPLGEPSPVDREVVLAMASRTALRDFFLGRDESPEPSLEGEVQKEADRLRATLALTEAVTAGKIRIRDAEGRVEFDLSRMPRLERAELEATLDAAFGGEFRINRLQGRIRFDRQRTPQWAFDLATDMTTVIRNTRLDAEGRLVLREGEVTAELEAALRRSFGPRTRIESDLSLKYDATGLSGRVRQAVFHEEPGLDLRGMVDLEVGPDGLQDLRLFGAVKRLMGAAQVSAEGDIRVRPGSGSEVKAALEILHGDRVQIETDGSVRFDADGRLSEGEFVQSLELLWDRGRIDTRGRVRFDGEGAIRGDLEKAIQTVLGSRTELDGNLRLSFDDRGVDFEEARMQVESELGRVNVEANLRYDGELQGALSLAALKTLKAHSNRDALQIEASGRISFDEDRITRAEIETLLSVAGQRPITVGLDGTLRNEDGEIDLELSARMERTFDRTRLSSQGRLSFQDESLRSEWETALNTDFGRAQATLELDGGQPERLELMAQGASPSSRVDGLGMLRIDREGMEARLRARFSWSPVTLSLDGRVEVQQPPELVQGRWHMDRTVTRGIGAELSLPTPFSIQAAADAARTERISIRAPEEHPDLPQRWMVAMREGDPSALNDLEPGTFLERRLDQELGAQLQIRLNSLGTAPGPVAGSFSFGSEASSEDILAVQATTRPDGKVDAEVSKIDVSEVRRELSLRLGIDVSDTQLAEFLRQKLVLGIDVPDVVPNLNQILEELRSRIEIELGTERTRSDSQVQTLRFQGLDPSNQQDAAVLGALLLDLDPGDVARIPDERQNELRRERAFQLALEAFGLEIMMRRDSLVELSSVERFQRDGSVFESHRASGEYRQEQRGIFEDHQFQGRMLRLMERVRSPDGQSRTEDLGTMAHIEHRLQDQVWRRGQARNLERAVNAADLEVVHRHAGPTQGLIIPNYGEGDIRLQLALSSRAFDQWLQQSPSDLRQQATRVAAAIEGTFLPPSERPSPPDLPTHAAAIQLLQESPQALLAQFPDAHVQSMQAILDRRSSVQTGRMGLAIRILRGRGPRTVPPEVVQHLARYSDPQLAGILRQATAGAMLADDRPRVDSEEERRDKSVYRRFTGGRSLEDDRWIAAQGQAMVEVFQQVKRRAGASGAGPVRPEHLVQDVSTFVNVVGRMAPGRFASGGRPDREALTFYATLLSRLDPAEAVALVDVDTERYRLRAKSPGRDGEPNRLP